MNKGSLKRFAYSAAAGLTTLFGLSALSACNLEMVKEVGYTSSRYAVTAQFTQIEIDAEGGLEFSLSYGDQFSVTYTESEQDKLVFSTENDTLFVTQHSDVALIGYKKKELSIVVPTDNKISSVKASSGGALECSLAGEYGALSFESDGILSGDGGERVFGFRRKNDRGAQRQRGEADRELRRTRFAGKQGVFGGRSEV